jgi:crossover junction endodeoxyribonuclease RuvC
MKILGLDPGTARVGWGVIEGNRNTPAAIAFGCITTEPKTAPERRLAHIHKELTRIIKSHKPDAISVERLFFSANVTTAFAVGEARGVILLAAAQAGIPVVSYTPQTVKQSVCGNGRAEKRQVQKMVTLILRLKEIPKPDDTADALAIALTHAVSHTMKTKIL